MSNPNTNKCDFNTFKDDYGNMSCRWKNGRVFHMCLDCYDKHDHKSFDHTCEHSIKNCYCSDCNYGSGRDDDYACDCCNCLKYRHCDCSACYHMFSHMDSDFNDPDDMCECCLCEDNDNDDDDNDKEEDDDDKEDDN